MLLVSNNQVRDKIEELGDEYRRQPMASRAPLLMLCTLECQLWTDWYVALLHGATNLNVLLTWLEGEMFLSYYHEQCCPSK